MEHAQFGGTNVVGGDDGVDRGVFDVGVGGGVVDVGGGGGVVVVGGGWGNKLSIYENMQCISSLSPKMMVRLWMQQRQVSP